MKAAIRNTHDYPGASAPEDGYGWCIVADEPIEDGVMAGPYMSAEYARALLFEYQSADSATVELRRIVEP